MARVDEDDSAALIELGPDGLKVLVAEILAVVRREERDTVSLELVKRVLQGLDGSLDIRKAGQSTEEAKLFRLIRTNGRSVVVPFTSEVVAGRGVAFGWCTCDLGAGGGKGEDGG